MVTLEESMTVLRHALQRLDAAERAWRAAPEHMRVTHWRPWAARVRELFQAADACWPTVVAVLAQAEFHAGQRGAARRRRWWRGRGHR